MVAARSRVRALKTARLISATSAFSTASTSVSCVFAAWSCSSFAVSSFPKGAILLKFISKSWVISLASSSSGAAKCTATRLLVRARSCTKLAAPAAPPPQASLAWSGLERVISLQKSASVAAVRQFESCTPALPFALAQTSLILSLKVDELVTCILSPEKELGSSGSVARARAPLKAEARRAAGTAHLSMERDILSGRGGAVGVRGGEVGWARGL
mmetsp:Transcript_97873/g.258528  ORF Transcript_97873/g.258528 Transcript_97873/m.258528 type:complete len:215 (+) Transcript_97873:253-897(+)